VLQHLYSFFKKTPPSNLIYLISSKHFIIKKAWKVLNKKNIDLSYVDHINYNLTIITKVNIL